MKALIGITYNFQFTHHLFNDEEEFNKQQKDISYYPIFLFYERIENDKNNNDKDYNINSTKEIILYFFCTAAYGNIYIRTRTDEIFSSVIQKLKDKYPELKILKNLKFYSDTAILDENKTLAENGILESYEISIEVD